MMTDNTGVLAIFTALQLGAHVSVVADKMCGRPFRSDARAVMISDADWRHGSTSTMRWVLNQCR